MSFNTHLSKPKESTTQGVTPHVNYRLWVVMRCQCGFTDCKKCSTLDGKGSWECSAGAGVGIWEFSVLYACLLTYLFIGEPKTAVKNSLFKRKKKKSVNQKNNWQCRNYWRC